MISPTGDGLKIIIDCNYVGYHNWMTFASWYSISKNLPDAKVEIRCKRGELRENLFNWTVRCKVPFVQYSNEYVKNGEMIITPDIMAVSYYDINVLGPFDVRQDVNSTFVSYLERCGKFVMAEWINTSRSPFSVANNMFAEDMTLNEHKVLKLWAKANLIYKTIA